MYPRPKVHGRANFGAKQRHGPTLLRPTEAHLHACTGQFRSHSAPVLFYCARVHRVVTISVIPSVIFRRAALSVQVVHLVHRDLGSVLSVYRPTCCVGCKEKAHFRARAWPDGRGVKFFHGMLADGVRPPEVREPDAELMKEACFFSELPRRLLASQHTPHLGSLTHCESRFTWSGGKWICCSKNADGGKGRRCGGCWRMWSRFVALRSSV